MIIIIIISLTLSEQGYIFQPIFDISFDLPSLSGWILRSEVALEFIVPNWVILQRRQKHPSLPVRLSVERTASAQRLFRRSNSTNCANSLESLVPGILPINNSAIESYVPLSLCAYHVQLANEPWIENGSNSMLDSYHCCFFYLQ